VIAEGHFAVAPQCRHFRNGPNAELSCRALLPEYIRRGPSTNHDRHPLRGQLQLNVTCQPPDSIGPPIRSVFKLEGCAGVMLSTRRASCASPPRRVFPRKAAGAARWGFPSVLGPNRGAPTRGSSLDVFVSSCPAGKDDTCSPPVCSSTPDPAFFTGPCRHPTVFPLKGM